MLRLTLLAATFTVLLAPVPARAAVFERDWKVPGDGLLTYDDVNRREWLDLSETLLEQFPGATLEDRYQSVVGELMPGGIFHGFTVADSDDVIGLAESAGIDTSMSDFGTNAVPVLELIDLLGPTHTNDLGRLQARGFLEDVLEGPFAGRLEAIVDYSPPRPLSVGSADVLLSTSSDLQSSTRTAVMLFRVEIPEPTAQLLAYFCVAIYWFSRDSSWRSRMILARRS